MAIVYQATNLVNGKRYIGVTKLSLDRRRYQHEHDARKGRTRAFSKALRKYGPTSFKWEVIHDYLFPEAAMEAEERFVAKLKPEYNMTAGGIGVRGLTFSEESRAKMRASFTPERKAAYRAKVTGRKNTPEAIARMSAAQKGKPKLKLRGRPKSDYVREVARQQGIKNKELFLSRVKGVPRGNERRVLCVDDGGREFASASAAARYYGVGKSGLIEMCLGTSPSRHVGGHTFRYVDFTPPEWPGKRREKLTAEAVRKIRELLPTMSRPKLGRMFGVHAVTITDIAVGRSWKGVP